MRDRRYPLGTTFKKIRNDFAEEFSLSPDCLEAVPIKGKRPENEDLLLNFCSGGKYSSVTIYFIYRKNESKKDSEGGRGIRLDEKPRRIVTRGKGCGCW